MKKYIKIFSWLFLIFVVSIFLYEVNDVLNPSDSGDMGDLNFYLETRKAKNGDVNAALHLAKYHEYNGNFKEEYEVLISLIKSKKPKLPSEWERIIGSALENCHYTGLMGPIEISDGFASAEKDGELTEAAKEMKNRWNNGEYSRCIQRNNK